METEAQRRIDFGGRRCVLAATPPRSASRSIGIPVLCHMSNQLGHVAGVNELDTQRDDVKIGSADGEAVTLKGERMLYDMRVFH